MYDVAYCGYSEIMLQHLLDCPDFNVCAVLTVQKRINNKFSELLKNHGLDSCFVENKLELVKRLQLLKKVDCVIIYKFEFIIPDGIVKRGLFFNFHGGDLRTNRGANPIVWSILSKEKDSCLSLYKLTGGIDEGLLISEYRVAIDDNETSVTLDRKLAEGIPILLPKLLLYLQGKVQGELIANGTYRRRIVENDFTIDLENDTLDDISAKIRSQKAYNGAILHYKDNRYRVHDMYTPSEKNRRGASKSLNVFIGTKEIVFDVTIDEGA